MTAPAPLVIHANDTALWHELRPRTILQQIFATEALRAAARLRKCAEAEEILPPDEAENRHAHTALDRARSQAFTILRRSLSELRRLQAGSEKSPAQNEPNPATSELPQSDPVEARIPRNAACPCGSGQKYKRCCGRNAPPVSGLASPVRPGPFYPSPVYPR